MSKKIEIILGGTSGLGLSLAEYLGKEQPVLIGGRNKKRLDDAIAYLNDHGVKEAYGMNCDISDMDSLKAFIEYAQSLGTIGDVVNSAGVDESNGDAEMIWKVNVQGTINVAEAFYPYMQDACLVNYSSVPGYSYPVDAEEIEIWSNPNAPDFMEKSFEHTQNKKLEGHLAFMGDLFKVYIASKRFIMHYTQANTKRMGLKHCRVFSICPGAIYTPMFILNDPEKIAKMQLDKRAAFGRAGDPEECSYFTAKLMSPENSYVTGVDMIIDGGVRAIQYVKQIM